MFTPIILQTRAGEFVATVNVPTMKAAPEIVLWGARYFVRQSADLYREGLLWVVSDAAAPADG